VTIFNDVRAATKLLVKDRAFTVTAVVALALGIGALNTVFTLVNGIFLRDLPFRDADRIVSIDTRNPGNARNPFDNMSLPDVRDLQTSSRTFEGIGATDEVTMNVSDDEHAAERFIGAYASYNTFALLGWRPALGRDFRSDDDRSGADPVVILGHRIWRNRYGGDPHILGRMVRVNGVPSTVIGVMPEGFGFPSVSGLWQPLAFAGPFLADRGARAIDAFGRMAPGITIERATEDLARVMDGLARAHPDTNREVTARVRPFRALNTGGPVPTTFRGLGLAVAFLLLIACANVANLLLARGATRAREISLRLSLGATRGQIVRQLLAESLVLAFAAGIPGVLLAIGGVWAVRAAITGTGEPFWLQFPIEGPVLAFFVAVCLGTAVLSGLAPALHASKAGIAGLLNESGRMSGGTRSRRWTGVLVVVQLALTPILLTGAALVIRNVMALTRVEAGVDTSSLLKMRINLPEQRYASQEQRSAFYDRLDERLRALPGVRAGVGTFAPLGGAYSRPVSVDGRQAGDSPEGRRASNVPVGPAYFDALGIRPKRGRTFTQSDGGPGLPSAIVNDQFAERFLPGIDPLGQRIALDAANGVPASGWLTVVGVVPNVRHEENDPQVAEPVVYVPQRSVPLSFATIVAGSYADAAAATNAVRDVVATLDSDLPLFDVMTLADALAVDLRPFRVFGTLFVVFAVAALALAMVGIYAVTARSVAVRTRELGIRMALGARAAHIWWVVTRRAAIHLGVGLVLGAAGALGMGQLLQGVLSGVSGRDPATLVVVLCILALVVLVACIPSARRATRLDPVAALRSE
jgi:predicted permease